MKRTLAAILVFSFAAAAGAAPAAAEYSEGQDYVSLATPLPQANPAKIEVNEIFVYSEKDLETPLALWRKALPADVGFVQTCGGYRPVDEIGCKGFYTLGTLGYNDLKAKVFSQMMANPSAFQSSEGWIALLVAHGMDRAKATETYNSFSVQAAVTRAKQLTKSSGWQSNPEFIVGGKYKVRASGKTFQEMLKIVDFLIGKVRAERATTPQ